MQLPWHLLLAATFVSAILAVRGYRKQSLTKTGALTAFVVGWCTLACGHYVHGFVLIAFYWMGTQVTRVSSFHVASAFEESHSPFLPYSTLHIPYPIPNTVDRSHEEDVDRWRIQDGWTTRWPPSPVQCWLANVPGGRCVPFGSTTTEGWVASSAGRHHATSMDGAGFVWMLRRRYIRLGVGGTVTGTTKAPPGAMEKGIGGGGGGSEGRRRGRGEQPCRVPLTKSRCLQGLTEALPRSERWLP